MRIAKFAAHLCSFYFFLIWGAPVILAPAKVPAWNLSMGAFQHCARLARSGSETEAIRPPSMEDLWHALPMLFCSDNDLCMPFVSICIMKCMKKESPRHPVRRKPWGFLHESSDPTVSRLSRKMWPSLCAASKCCTSSICCGAPRKPSTSCVWHAFSRGDVWLMCSCLCQNILDVICYDKIIPERLSLLFCFHNYKRI